MSPYYVTSDGRPTLRKPEPGNGIRVGSGPPSLRFKPSFYTSPAWVALRYETLKKSAGACECCGDGPKPGKPLHVDHIKPRSKHPELELEPSNLQVLCHDCNMGKSNRDATDWRIPKTGAAR